MCVRKQVWIGTVDGYLLIYQIIQQQQQLYEQTTANTISFSNGLSKFVSYYFNSKHSVINFANIYRYILFIFIRITFRMIHVYKLFFKLGTLVTLMLKPPLSFLSLHKLKVKFGCHEIKLLHGQFYLRNYLTEKFLVLFELENNRR